MKLKVLTFTGADDSVEPEDLLEISRQYPFVEWGILLSKSQEGGNRFPSRIWTDRLAALAGYHAPDKTPRLSGHLCGLWCRSLAVGVLSIPPGMKILDSFERFQLNFHAENLVVDTAPFMDVLEAFKETGHKIIFQIDGVNDRQFHVARAAGLPVFPLFDLSHGAGIAPKAWPVPLHTYCGYAGGLGPDNIGEELRRIADAAGETPFWIDMETRVRSHGNTVFDLDKVRRVIDIVAPFVEA